MIVRNRKGISTFIATLLLMVLAVAAGIVIYAYTMGYLGGVGNPNTMGAMSIDSSSYSATTAPTGLTVFIRNIGKTPLQGDTLYVDGVKLTDAQWTWVNPAGGNVKKGTGNPSLAEGTIGTLNIIPGAFTGGAKTYEIKLICVDNTQISFNAKAG